MILLSTVPGKSPVHTQNFSPVKMKSVYSVSAALWRRWGKSSLLSPIRKSVFHKFSLQILSRELCSFFDSLSTLSPLKIYFQRRKVILSTDYERTVNKIANT